MTNKFKFIATGVASVSMLALQAMATPVLPGSSISFDGTYTANGSGPGGLTGATAISTVTADVNNIPAPTGSFTGLGGLSANFGVPIQIGANTSTSLLWSVVDGPLKYEFISTSEATPTTTSSGGQTTADALSGTGLVEIWDGASEVGGPTAGSWGITLNSTLDQLVFTATSGVGTPDGGATMLMLGGVFSALGVLRRKLGSK